MHTTFLAALKILGVANESPFCSVYYQAAISTIIGDAANESFNFEDENYMDT